MRILVIANKLPYPPIDGGAIATLYLALGLADAGLDVSMLSINTKKHYFDITLIPENIAGKIKFYAVYSNTDISFFKIIRNLFFSKLPYNAERFLIKDFYTKLIELLSNQKFDIIQIEGLYMLPYIETIRQLSNAPVVYRAHNLESEIWRNYRSVKHFIKRQYLKNLYHRIKNYELSLINKYDALVAISKNDLIQLEKLGNKKTGIVIPAAIAFTEPIIKNPLPNSLAYIGALDWQPNRDGLIWFIQKVWNEVLVAVPDAQFYVAGRNAPPEFANYLKKMNVQFLGEVADARKFIADKTRLVIPLFAGSGVRIKIIEAMVAGNPVVCTSKAAEGLGVLHNKHVLIGNTHEKFAAHAINLLTNIEKRNFLSENSKQFVSKNFDTFALANRLISFYGTLTKNVNRLP